VLAAPHVRTPQVKCNIQSAQQSPVLSPKARPSRNPGAVESNFCTSAFYDYTSSAKY